MHFLSQWLLSVCFYRFYFSYRNPRSYWFLASFFTYVIKSCKLIVQIKTVSLIVENRDTKVLLYPCWGLIMTWVGEDFAAHLWFCWQSQHHLKALFRRHRHWFFSKAQTLLCFHGKRWANKPREHSRLSIFLFFALKTDGNFISSFKVCFSVDIY